MNYQSMKQLKNEKEIVEKVKTDPKEFSKIYEHYYSKIFNFILKRTLNFETSRDITSEVFLKAFIAIGKFKWKGISISFWLYRIAVNEVNLYYRSKKYSPEVLIDSYGDVIFNNYSSDLSEEKNRAEKELQDNQKFIALSKNLKKLPLKYQEVITLKYFEKLKIREISQILNIKEGTIKSLLSRGLKKLKKIMLSNPL